MNLRRLLTEDVLLLNLQGRDKESIIREMVDHLAALGKIGDRETVLKAVLEREKRMSTGMQYGIAIPHGKTDVVENIVTALGLKHEGIDFDCLDGLPAQIIILTISPANRAGPHIQFMSEISRILNAPEVRQRLLQSSSPAEMAAALFASEPA